LEEKGESMNKILIKTGLISMVIVLSIVAINLAGCGKLPSGSGESVGTGADASTMFFGGASIRAYGGTRSEISGLSASTTYTLSGYVRNAATGAVIAGANVFMIIPNVTIEGVSTDSNGHYSFSDVPEGDILIGAVPGAWVNPDDEEVYDIRSIVTDAKNVDFRLYVRSQDTASIETTVVDSQGEPIAGAYVQYYNGGTGGVGYYQGGGSDAEGLFSGYRLPSGSLIGYATKVGVGCGVSQVVSLAQGETKQVTITIPSVQGSLVGTIELPAGFSPSSIQPIVSLSGYPIITLSSIVTYENISENIYTYTASLAAGAYKAYVSSQSDAELLPSGASLHNTAIQFNQSPVSIVAGGSQIRNFAPVRGAVFLEISSNESMGNTFITLTWEAPSSDMEPGVYMVQCYSWSAPHFNWWAFTKGTSITLPVPTGSRFSSISVLAFEMDKTVDLSSFDLMSDFGHIQRLGGFSLTGDPIY
jgi:hypothetical protein